MIALPMTHHRHELTADLDAWRVTLKMGEILRVRAHGLKELEGHYVFVALMAGSPAYEYELVRLPISAVADLVGG